MVRIKICGMTGFEDAARAVDAGADALGFNFWPKSPRFIPPEEARRVIDRLPPFMVTVGVFVNQFDPEALAAQVLASGVHTVQLHGDESPAYCRTVSGRWPTIRALRVGPDFDPVRLGEYGVQAILLDTQVKGEYGGTGQVFDWSLALRAKSFVPQLILAGGLTVENIGEAIAMVRPYAVDVCSSVESAPGKKDPAKVLEFIRRAREA